MDEEVVGCRMQCGVTIESSASGSSFSTIPIAPKSSSSFGGEISGQTRVTASTKYFAVPLSSTMQIRSSRNALITSRPLLPSSLPRLTETTTFVAQMPNALSLPRSDIYEPLTVTSTGSSSDLARFKIPMDMESSMSSDTLPLSRSALTGIARTASLKKANNRPPRKVAECGRCRKKMVGNAHSECDDGVAIKNRHIPYLDVPR
ncbi:hypothetical protein BC829DRAFT_446785 [Chytridium lagenaria]|nr:hypothetical protein BC829DRAFT_446785 [Chytridium lagenaria]